MAVSLPGANRSRYARLYGGEPGIDPYTRAVSDVYQDLFGEGSFIGKGIYDVDAFEQALERALPREPDPQPRSAGRLLCPLRAAERRAVVRGIPVPLQRGREPPPPLDSRRLADCALAAARRSRPRRAPAAAIRSRRCRAGRSSTTCGAACVPPALTLLLLLGWTVLPPAWFWTLAVIGIILIPAADRLGS